MKLSELKAAYDAERRAYGPRLLAEYRAARRRLIEECNERRMTQTEAAEELGVSLQCLGMIVRREGIKWLVKRQGQRKKTLTQVLEKC